MEPENVRLWLSQLFLQLSHRHIIQSCPVSQGEIYLGTLRKVLLLVVNCGLKTLYPDPLQHDFVISMCRGGVSFPTSGS